jgi:phage terminase small subunit
MPVLSNERHEKFAQFLAMGKKRIEAHELAGYTPSRANSSTLANQQHIKARVAELQGRAAEIAIQVAQVTTGISKSWVLEQLRDNALKGLKQKNGSAVANRALELIGREIGMFVDRVEQGKPGDFAHLSDEELDAQMTQRLKARGIPDRYIRNFLLATNPVPANCDDKESA